MATSSYKSFLMYKKSGETYEKLVDIKDYPDIGEVIERAYSQKFVKA